MKLFIQERRINMALDRFLNTPTVTIDQSRYEELVKTELKYEQYKKAAPKLLQNVIEIDNNTGENDENHIPRVD